MLSEPIPMLCGIKIENSRFIGSFGLLPKIADG